MKMFWFYTLFSPSADVWLAFSPDGLLLPRSQSHHSSCQCHCKLPPFFISCGLCWSQRLFLFPVWEPSWAEPRQLMTATTKHSYPLQFWGCLWITSLRLKTEDSKTQTSGIPKRERHSQAAFGFFRAERKWLDHSWLAAALLFVLNSSTRDKIASFLQDSLNHLFVEALSELKMLTFIHGHSH